MNNSHIFELTHFFTEIHTSLSKNRNGVKTVPKLYDQVYICFIAHHLILHIYYILLLLWRDSFDLNKTIGSTNEDETIMNSITYLIINLDMIF